MWCYYFVPAGRSAALISPRNSALELAQYYDTTVVDCDSNRALRTIVVPARSITPEDRGGLVDWLRLLGLEAVAFVPSEEEAVAALIGSLNTNDPEAVQLCRTVLGATTIPFENGSLGAASLLGIAASAGVALSSVMAVVRLQHLQFLLVAVPLGVAMCGNAMDITEALRLGLEERLRRLMGLDGSRVRPVNPAR